MTLTKDLIAESIQQTSQVTKAEAVRYLEFIQERIKRTLAGGEDVLISGFGKFYVHSKYKRRGRNPATGEDLVLDARRVVRFRSSLVLKEKVNGGRSR